MFSTLILRKLLFNFPQSPISMKNAKRYLKQLPAGWVETEKGFKITHENGASCEVIKYSTGMFPWVVVNISEDGAKWAQSYSSFKQFLAAVLM